MKIQLKSFFSLTRGVAICIPFWVAFAAPLAEAKAISLVKQGSYAISSSFLQSILAKEMCSCVFVSKVGGESASLEIRAEKCVNRSQLPLSPDLLSLLLHEKIDPQASSIEVTPKVLGALLGLFQGHGALAIYEGDKVGCRLLTDDERRRR